jgi:hypothetical protein
MKDGPRYAARIVHTISFAAVADNVYMALAAYKFAGLSAMTEPSSEFRQLSCVMVMLHTVAYNMQKHPCICYMLIDDCRVRAPERLALGW